MKLKIYDRSCANDDSACEKVMLKRIRQHALQKRRCSCQLSWVLKASLKRLGGCMLETNFRRG